MKENSIEEDIAIEHILTDYKRILKENELKDKTIDLMAQYIKNKN